MSGETLAGLALLDPVLKVIRNLNRIRKTVRSFGEDFIYLSNSFFDEVVTFEALFADPIELLLDEETRHELAELLHWPHPLDWATIFQPESPAGPKAYQVLEAISTLKNLFEECSLLIQRYQPLDEPSSSNFPTAGGPSTPAPDLAQTGSQQPLSDNAGIGQGSATEAVGAPRSRLGGRLAPIRNAILSRRRDPVQSPSSGSQPADRVDDTNIDRHRRLRRAQAQNLQDTVPLRLRLGRWALEDLNNFQDMLQKIHQKNMFLYRLLTLKNPQQNSVQQVAIHDSGDDYAGTQEDVGSYIAALENVFDHCDRRFRTTFAVAILEDYKDHARKCQIIYPYLGLKPEQWLMPVMALFSGAQHPVEPPQPNEQSEKSHMLFAIAENARPHSDGQVAHKIWRWNPLREISESPNPRPPYNKVFEALCINRYQYTIFQQFPPGLVQQTADLTTVFTHEKFRQDSEQFSIRYYLALLITKFFVKHQSKDVDIRSRKIIFLLEKPFKEFEFEDLNKKLRQPYLTSIDKGQETESMDPLHAPILLDGASPHQLGVLLNEIGCWSPITKPESRQRISLEKAVEEARARPPPYFLGRKYNEAMQQCLNWQGRFRPAEFERKVLRHLRALGDHYPPDSNATY